MRFLLIILFLGLITTASAQYDSAFLEDETYETTEEYQYDEEATEEEEEVEHVMLAPQDLGSTKAYTEEEVYNKHFDQSKWREVIGETDYTQEEVPEFKPNLPSMPWAGTAIKVIAWTIVIALILFLVYFLYQNIKFTKKVRSTSGIGSYPGNEVEDIHEMNIPEMLKQALAAKNFKLAVRLYYLSLLKNLHDAGLIHWEKDKTNRDYLGELFSKEAYYNDVRKLTRNYEEVWYGDRAMADESLLAIIASFETVNQKLNPPKNL
jgi:hypothetical protein